MVLPQLPDCTACDLHRQSDTCPRSVGIGAIHVPASLPLASRAPLVVFVGRNPGLNEDVRAQPFVGKSGLLLRGGYTRNGNLHGEILDREPVPPPDPAAHPQWVPGAYVDGISLRPRASVWAVNAVRCYTDGNEPPKRAHYKACLPYLERDLQSLATAHGGDLRILVLLGGDCTSNVFQKLITQKAMSLTKAINGNGDVHQVAGHEWHVFATYHPSAVLRNPNNINAVHSHNQLISDCVAGTMARASEPNIVPTRPPETLP